jgi:hypothetical protein
VGKRKRANDRGRRRPQHHSSTQRRAAGSAADQQLLLTLRKALRSDQPLDLLAVVSGLLEVTDPRRRDPFNREEPHTTRDELVESFITGSVSQRAEPLLRANGVNPHELFGTMALGTPDLLTAAKRREIITERDRWSGSKTSAEDRMVRSPARTSASSSTRRRRRAASSR